MTHANQYHYPGSKYFLIWIVFLSISLNSLGIQAAPEKISIQLKWTHSFQFAGYYAAIEKGFYRDFGLDVSLKEVDFSKDHVEQVINGESEYGTSDSNLLIYHLNGQPVVLLQQYFQHSPLVFLSRRDSGIISPYEMIDKKVALNNSNQGDAALNTLLHNTLGDVLKIHQIDYDETYFQKFINGQIDVIFAYSTSEPYLLKEQGVEVNIINPQNYGIDFYGDNIFTTQKELEEHPERVENMIRATMKGWQYSLDHPDEIIKLIQDKYNPAFSTDYLHYEARTTRQMIIPELIKLGSIDPMRYQRTAEEYKRLGFSKTSQITSNFFYQQATADEANLKLSPEQKTWLQKHPVIPVGIDGNWPPIDFFNDAGNHSGITADYLDLIGKRLGIKFQPVDPGTFKQMLDKLKQGELKVGASTSRSKLREKTLLFSKPYISTERVIYIRDNRQDIHTLSDLKNQTVAVENGFLSMRQLQSDYKQIHLMPVQSTLEALRAVAFGKADAYVGNQAVADWLRKKQFISNLKIVGNSGLGVSSQNFSVSRLVPEWAPLIDIIDTALADIKPEEHNSILNRWLVDRQRISASIPALHITKEEQQWLDNHPVLRVGADSNWPPFEFIDQSGQLQGISADVMRLVAQRLDIQLQMESIDNWSQTLKQARQYNVDVLVGAIKTDQREQYLNFTEPYFTPPIVIYTRKDHAAISGINDIKHETVVVENHYFIHEYLTKEYPDLKLLLVDSTTDALKALSYGQADAYLGNQGAANWVIEKHALMNLAMTPSTDLDQAPIRIAVRKDWPILVNLLNKALQSISSLEMANIRHHWLGIEPSKKTLPLNLQQKAWIDTHRIIRVANEQDWPPFDYVVNNKPHGYSIDLIRLIAEKTGLQVEFVNGYSWDQLLELTRRGEIDVLPAVWRTTEREKYFQFTNSYHTESHVLVVRKNSSLSSLQDLSNFTIAGISEFATQTMVMNKNPDIRLLDFDDIDQALRAVSIGKADAYIGSLGAVSFAIQNGAIPGLKVANTVQLLDHTEFGHLRMAVAGHQDILISILQTGLDAISLEEKRQLQQRWLLDTDLFSTEQSDTSHYGKWLLFGVVLLCGALLAVLFILTRMISDEVLVKHFGSGGFRVPILAGVTVTIILVTIVIYFVLAESRKQMLEQTRENLDVTLQGTMQRVDNWFNENRHFLEQLSQNGNLRASVKRLIGNLPARHSSGFDDTQQSLNASLRTLTSKVIHADFQIIDRTMTTIANTRQNQLNEMHPVADALEDRLSRVFSGETILLIPTRADSKLGTDNGEQLPTNSCYLAAPIFDENDMVIAVLIQDFHDSYGLSEVLRYGRIGTSGESYAIDQTGFMVSESRFRNQLNKMELLEPGQNEIGVLKVLDPGVNLISSGQPDLSEEPTLTRMADALIKLGKQGIGRVYSEIITDMNGYNDYRGVTVFGVGMWNFPLSIGVTTEIDAKESLAGYHRLRITLISVAGLLLLLLTTAVVFTLSITSRAGHIMRRSQDQLEDLVDSRTSELKHSEHSLLTSNKRLALAAQAINLGIWDWDINTDTIQWDDRMYSIYGIDNSTVISELSWKILVYPEDRHLANISLAALQRQGGQNQTEFRIIHSDGSIRYIYAAQTLINNENNQPETLLGVNWDITTTKEAERALKIAKMQAETANRAKSEFLANMSHEIRTPMNAILGFTELLDDQITEPRLSAFVKTIRSAGKNLLQLINDVLDLSKIEAGKMDIEKIPSNLHELFTEIGNIFAINNSKQDLEFILDIDSSIPHSILLDATRLRQVLFNLIGNAFKFTEKGHVRVKARTDNKDIIRSKVDVLIAVEDTGIGIPEDQLQQIFNAFVQTSGQSQAQFGGTGLGLSISQRLIEMMGGQISVDSQVGQGTVFTVSLRDVHISSVLPESNSNSETFDSRRIQFQPATILVVDDAPDNIGLLRENFRDTSLTVLEAANGQEAVKIARSKNPDLILMDLRMPVMDGYQATDQIKSFSQIPIIALTASVMKDEFERAKSSNFDGYLRKPVLRSVLFKELIRFLPYDYRDSKKTNQYEISFNEKDLPILPVVLEQIESLTSQWEKAIEKNNFAEIKKFLSDINSITEHYSIDCLQNYTDTLVEKTDAFDIAGIQSLLKEFPNIKNELGLYLKTQQQ